MSAALRVELFVADVTVAVRFYREVLGFEPPHGTDVSPSYVAVRRGTAVIGLGSADALPADHPAARGTGRAGAGVELVVEVDDVVAARDHAVAAGAELASDLATQPWGLTDFRLVDPDGFYVRVTGR
jgi:lactoylglutathione lyase